jgi:hypothetical protein
MGKKQISSLIGLIKTKNIKVAKKRNFPFSNLQRSDFGSAGLNPSIILIILYLQILLAFEARRACPRPKIYYYPHKIFLSIIISIR